MTTLMTSSFKRRLEFVAEEVAELAAAPVHEDPQEALHWCIEIVETMLKNVAELHQELRDMLANGLEARSFKRKFGPTLAPTDDALATIQEAIELLSTKQEPASESLATQLRLLDQNVKVFRDLLAEALSKASEPHRPVDWDRVRAAEEAYARGETKPFAQQ